MYLRCSTLGCVYHYSPTSPTCASCPYSLDLLPCVCVTTVHVYLSLGSTNITTNNTEVLITDIGEDHPGGLSRLTCHTDLTECCRNSDTGGQGGRGEWYYPDGRTVQNYAVSMAAGEGFYRVRNAPQVVRLARRDASNPLSPTGSYCCVIPTTRGEMTFCANISECTVYCRTVSAAGSNQMRLTDRGFYINQCSNWYNLETLHNLVPIVAFSPSS